MQGMPSMQIAANGNFRGIVVASKWVQHVLSAMARLL
jgi:hypothetical protein